MDKKNTCYLMFLRFTIAANLVLMVCLPATAQVVKTVTGTVVDTETNEALPGVNVRLKGTNSGTLTNEAGVYNVKVGNAGILVFSSLGYEPLEISIGSKTVINARLKTSLNSLKEIVVIGYGTTTREDMTGSVGIVDVKSLANAPVASFDQALAGRIAGVQVSSNEGQPGGEGVNIVIRGNGSLTQSNAPLYVVDGFPIEDFDNGSLNSDDIESINVLKDASATAIYGARGANGVIIIETKKGKVGAPVVTYNGSVGYQEVIKRMDMMNAYEFVKYQIDRTPSRKVTYTPGDLDPADLSYDPLGRTLESYKNVKGVNWQDQLFQNGSTNIHNIAVRGGTDQTRYSVSGSVYDANAIIINTGNSRYQGRFSLDQTFNRKLKAGVNLNYSSISSFGREASIANTGGSASSYLLYATLGYRPVTGSIDFSEEDFVDDVVDDEINPLEDYRVNPIVSTKNEYRQVLTNNLVSNAYLSYQIIPELTLKLTGGINSRAGKSEYFYNSKTARGTPEIPSNARGQYGGRTYSDRVSLSNENTLTYNKKLKNHTFNVVAGYSIQESNSESGGFTSTNVPNESLGINGLGDGIPYATTTRASIYRMQSFLVRANYNNKSKYLLTASYRADGSSKFLGGNQWGYFPSGAFAWRMSKEPFMKKFGFVSDAKFRVSYGLTGNNRVSDFAALALVDPNTNASYSYGNNAPTQGVNISSLGNKDLMWETTEQVDLGYDLSLFKNRVEIVFDVYRKTTKDLLLNANMPLHTGFNSIYKNIGKIQNQGLELSLSTVNVRNKNFRWESSFNISFNQNKILELTEGENNIKSQVRWETAYNNSPLYISKIGQPAGQMFGFIWEGNYQYSDFDEVAPGVYKLKNEITTNNNDRSNITVQPGDIKYKDLNGDGVINDFDLTVMGRSLPIHIGGFSNDFRYKNFSLGLFFQWSYGNDIYNANRLVFEGSTRQSLNQFASYEDRWTPENQSTEQYRIGGQGPAGVYSSKVVEDGSYLRLKTFFFGYSIPEKILKRTRIKNISLTASAQNLITWTSYSGFDPEVSTKNSVLTPGFDYSAYPHARTVVFGIKATL